MYKLLMGSALALTLVAGSLATADAQYYGQSLPPGSYQQSCRNISMNGPTLSASCSAANGQQVYSSINVSQCGGGGIMNSNGRLTCSGYNNGYGNGYGYGNGNGYGYNNGNGQQNGRRRHGHRRDNDNDDNNNGYNSNGYGNNGYGYGGSLPPGSYQASCSNESMRGPVLSATCTAPNGQSMYSSINVNSCMSRGATIRNENGRLRC